MPASLAPDKFKVLIVDDQQEILDLVRAFLQRHGDYEISTAVDGITALIAVGATKPDLLILDIMIPGMDGLEVCRRIKNDSTNKTAIIAVSGSAKYEREALQAGADAFIIKPIDLDALEAKTKRLLRVL
jgi:CheY-like chemotaxis protein